MDSRTWTGTQASPSHSWSQWAYGYASGRYPPRDFEVFPDEVVKRHNLGQTYSESLSHLEGLTTPRIGEHNTSVYAQYTILSEQREEIQQSLKEKDIPSVSYYSVPLHLQPVFKNLGYKEGDFPVAEKLLTSV